MTDPRSVEDLKQALKRLPGIGPKTAQRMAFHLLERDREGARLIEKTIGQALSRVNHCKRCNNFSETEVCAICASASRQSEYLCVVETPADLEAIEQAGVYRGTYFVLMGHLSPLDDVGPEQLAISELMSRVAENTIEEIILATNLTLEGQATGDYLLELLADRPVRITRLARGMPMGSELEYMDPGTLDQAFSNRSQP
ncbi:MAG: recombination protein RecR [Gammaproteobacteria bacterium]|nr:recombination protein RecR [Gammaproteobacteria bacterium]MYD75093.1 recombination protein RecR [Gammaproteobacteria bacterium]MYJ52896.1 recombination protein RecR [Gammaproteobacteria bacterium]